MATQYHWFYGFPDGDFPWESAGQQPVTLEALKSLAEEIDSLPYDGALFATGVFDVWVLALIASSYSSKFRPLVAIHPNLISPLLLAKMVASYGMLFKDRLLINVINGETPVMESFGLRVDHDARYELSSEYWSVFDRLITGETVTFEGKHIHAKNAVVSPGLRGGLGHVPLWFSGSSDPAIELAGKQFDKYLSWAEPPALLATKIGRVREKAAKYGRDVSYGLRMPVIVGKTDAEAWQIADHLIQVTRPETIKARLANLQKGGSYGGDSVGIQRQAQHINGIPARAQDLEISPNLWAGMTLLNAGAPAALVGSEANVAERIAEYEALGIDTFIFNSHPLREGARHVAETVISRLKKAAVQQREKVPA